MKAYVVRQDGKGTHTAIQAAIDAWVAGDRVPAKITIRPCQYAEQIKIPADSEGLILDGGND